MFLYDSGSPDVRFSYMKGQVLSSLHCSIFVENELLLRSSPPVFRVAENGDA